MNKVLRRVNRARLTTDHAMSRKVGVKSAAVPPSSQPAESAKQFLISKVLRQAVSDEVMLSDFEKQMLDFSEGAARRQTLSSREFRQRVWQRCV